MRCWSSAANSTTPAAGSLLKVKNREIPVRPYLQGSDPTIAAGAVLCTCPSFATISTTFSSCSTIRYAAITSGESSERRPSRPQALLMLNSEFVESAGHFRRTAMERDRLRRGAIAAMYLVA